MVLISKYRVKKIVITACIVVVTVWAIYLLVNPPFRFLNIYAQSPLSFLIHYEWDVSEDMENSEDAATAILEVEDHDYVLYISGTGDMCDFDFAGDNGCYAWQQFLSVGDISYMWIELKEVHVDNGITNIGEYAFYACPDLAYVTLPDSIMDIGSCSFGHCHSLSKIIFEGTVEQWNEIKLADNWADNSGIETITCSDGSVAVEKKVDPFYQEVYGL